MSSEKICDECGGINFRIANDSILQRQYPFVQKGKLLLCDTCGAKYVPCEKCGAVLTRVHLSLDVYGVTDTCKKCGTKNELVAQWIENGGEEEDFTLLNQKMNSLI